MIPTLETERTILRPLRLEDHQDIFSYAKNSNLAKYTLWETHKTPEDSCNFIKDYALSNYEKNIPEPFGIELKESHKIIGTVGCFWVCEKNQTMELAYALSEDYWRKGITTETSRVVLKYCFENYQVERIQCRCKSQNIGSYRVMEKLGMKYEGELRKAIFD
ncbi:MAG: GNAT family N-acetyltransferase, partial [Bacteriovoracaceae bacterium]